MSAPIPITPETLVTTYLQMTHPSQFSPAFVEDQRLVILKMELPDVAFYRFLYDEVGRDWRWRDRLLMTEEALQQLLTHPGASVYVLYVAGVPAGYVELCQEGNDTEITYLGLRTAYMGSGYGKHLLSYGINEAWKNGAQRVWLHTCNLDGPHALTNYLKRGFSVYNIDETPMPARYS
ncbi:MAG TPA: GNAT family N-acetyltransferase [Phototrophicaceae bacterium]|nr:GNAT family N-acetyltransferase [Phototrophicaceae bacterium]